MFKRKGGGQRPFEQCQKKLHFSYTMASLRTTIGKILSMKCLTLQMCDINQRPVLLYCWYCRAR